jgi:hypothetical protein
MHIFLNILIYVYSRDIDKLEDSGVILSQKISRAVSRASFQALDKADKGLILFHYYLLVIYFLLLLIFFCTYAFLAGLYGNIW